ncbi:helix-turn-helix domain-containing protein [Hymenobacter sp. CRA2]|uniref:helix-turn-helix domain-containing protein n=1 Tax=Hymenobacter sp. CRA2 TaxID=1955620 RepID=UPI00098F1236|nr:helix-turn-helix transcriptional regulator [Hymenobacter sp. CRA2]OON70054.1 hypothetical protein B0919_04720 [Hymenobacter sp. CRA2]
MFSAARILAIRKSKGLSQELLAEQSGLSLRTIQRVEQGDTVPRGHTLHALAGALGVTLDDFRPEPAPASPLPADGPTVTVRVDVSLPAEATTAPPTAGLRADPQFLQLLNLSALSLLVLPLLNIVVPLLLWRARRHDTEHVAEVGRRVVGFQVLWQVVSFFGYLLLVLGHWVAARYFQVVVPGTYLAWTVISYVFNVVTVLRNARRLRQGSLDIYPVRL